MAEDDTTGGSAGQKQYDDPSNPAEDLPPEDLHELGRSYFALEGKYRVSVARYKVAEWIDAEVTGCRAPLSDGRN